MKKIAYLILAHNDPIHLNKLVKELDYNSDIYIHIDKKSDIDSFKLNVDVENVFFIKDRVSVNWADISMINAQINLIDEVLRQSEKYTHAIFLSGSCFPVKKQKIIYEYFSSFPHKEFINFIDMRESPDHYMKQIKFKWFKGSIFNSNNHYINGLDKCIRFMLNKLKLKNSWNNDIIPYFGSQWIALTMECCKYVRDYHYSDNGFYKMNKYTFSPDEHYFHTIIGNSFFAKKSFGKKEFEGRGTWRLTNFHIIDKSLSKWYALNDWNEIVNRNEELFVRKINSQTGNDLVSKIKSELL